RIFCFNIVVVTAKLWIKIQHARGLPQAMVERMLMKKTLQALVLVGAVFIPAQAQLTHLQAGGPNPQLGDYFLEGTVMAIEKDSFTVSAPQDNQKVLVKVNVDGRAAILRQTQRNPVRIESVKLDNIHVGETILVRGSMQAGALQATR